MTDTRPSSSSYTVSIHHDRRLYKQDIAGSIVHTRMLAKQGIITDADAQVIVNGLETIREEIECGSFSWREELEDIHMNVEQRLYEKIGAVAGKLHTARSRNDQISLDMRLYARDATRNVLDAIRNLRQVLIEQAEANAKVVMPGYTHLQRAQPVLFSHHMLAYFEMFGRDCERFQQAYRRADVMPLGSGALAGVPYPIDREFIAHELGFGAISANSMDAVSDRDYLLDFHSSAATCMVHLSRLAEELVIWSSSEFAFIRLEDSYTTGSSIMPQKRNPDFAELARGKTGSVFGHLVALLTVLKGLPLTYSRDLQEDKGGFFDTVDVLISTLGAVSGMVSTMELDTKRLRDAAHESHVLATDIADYLVEKGMPFREAHGVVAKLSSHAVQNGKEFNELSLDTYRRFSGLFDADVLSITLESSIIARDIPGGTAFTRVERAIVEAKIDLEADGAF